MLVLVLMAVLVLMFVLMLSGSFGVNRGTKFQTGCVGVLGRCELRSLGERGYGSLFLLEFAMVVCELDQRGRIRKSGSCGVVFQVNFQVIIIVVGVFRRCSGLRRVHLEPRRHQILVFHAVKLKIAIVLQLVVAVAVLGFNFEHRVASEIFLLVVPSPMTGPLSLQGSRSTAMNLVRNFGKL